ncbi:MAG: tRNA lysidine(34) synthetase TilS [Steroidobacteraceae bacterium]|nr:tRNA lysidine(34) synthetase TilS [Steroidobacteraceae bacterium]MDW8260466.1 tRNA lysidine(34) synthetase TilS [Gammaproteobacteria bacterium]
MSSRNRARSAPQARRRPEPLTVEAIERRLAELAPEFPKVRMLLAFSGGVDSSVLLHLLVALRERHRGACALRAVHVNHGLSVHAAEWARYCRRQCRRLGVPLSVRQVDVRGRRRRGESLEAVARELRRGVFAQVLRPGEWLLTAQHADDQLETVLLQWLRGAGVAGLAGMAECAPFARGTQWRPLLAWRRAEIEQAARKFGLAPIIDDSNADLAFDRNYLRREVLPRLRRRWPAAAMTVARSARLCAEAAALLREVGRSDLQQVADADGAALRIEALARLSAPRQRNVLRTWLSDRGAPVPDAVHLERIRCELPAARPDAHPRVEWAQGHAVVRRRRGALVFEAH